MKEKTILLKKLRDKVFKKYFDFDGSKALKQNDIIKFNCLNCKKEVEAINFSSLGFTLLCKNCFNEKYNEFLKSKNMSFLNVNEDIKELWFEYFGSL
ncbi:MAG: hypothetical protein ABIL45_09650 [candidate division WOR-3 bacterium]